tara:strand:- start:323 stop:751 length:429 start_codon:yes stop_codon:yes gene_type:complete
MQLTLEYWNELAKQLILISSLLSGFSITVVANLLVSDKNDTLTNRILKAATLSAGSFLVSVFATVQIALITTPGYPLKEVTADDFIIPRIIGIIAFIVGLISLTTVVSLSGWTKSKKIGRYTTFIGVLTLILILVTLIKINY